MIFYEDKNIISFNSDYSFKRECDYIISKKSYFWYMNNDGNLFAKFG